DDFSDRRSHRCQCKRRCTTARVIVADNLKRFRRRLHRVAAQTAMDVQIDKSRREIISAEIDRSRDCWLADFHDFSVSDDDLHSVANCVRQNDSSIAKDHGANLTSERRSSPATRVAIPSGKPSARLNCQSRSSELGMLWQRRKVTRSIQPCSHMRCPNTGTGKSLPCKM